MEARNSQLAAGNWQRVPGVVLDIRRRTGVLLLVVVVGQLVLISAQVNTASGLPINTRPARMAAASGAKGERQRAT